MAHQPTDRATLWVFLALLAIFVFLVGKMVAPYFIPLMIGATIAILLAPLHEKILRRGHNPSLAATYVTLFVVVAILTPLTLLSLMATKQAMGLAQALSEGFDLTQSGLLETIKKLKDTAIFNSLGLGNFLNPEDLHDGLKDAASSVLKNSSNFIFNTAKSIPDGILQIFLAVLTLFFFLNDGSKGVQWVMVRLPLEPEIRTKIRDSFQSTAISVIWASMAAAGTQAALTLVTFAVLQIPSALLAAFATFIFAWIPLLGSTPVILVGGIYLYSQGSFVKLFILIVMGFITGIVDNFVRPLVLKGRGEMHPLISMVAIFGGISLMGIVGIFLGPITMAIAITLLKIWPIIGRKAGFFVDPE